MISFLSLTMYIHIFFEVYVYVYLEPFLFVTFRIEHHQSLVDADLRGR